MATKPSNIGYASFVLVEVYNMRTFLCKSWWGGREGDQKNDSASNCKVRENFPYTQKEEKCEPVGSEAL